MSISKQVERFGPFKDFIANGVKVGDTIYLSGQVSIDSDGAVVGEADLAAQVKQCYVNISEVLARYGATMENVVDEMWLVTNIGVAMGQIEELFTVRAEAYGKNPDVTQTMIQVCALVMPELLIEIKCVAKL